MDAKRHAKPGDFIKVIDKEKIVAGEDLSNGTTYRVFADEDGDPFIWDDAFEELCIDEEDIYGYEIVE